MSISIKAQLSAVASSLDLSSQRVLAVVDETNYTVSGYIEASWEKASTANSTCVSFKFPSQLLSGKCPKFVNLIDGESDLYVATVTLYSSLSVTLAPGFMVVTLDVPKSIHPGVTETLSIFHRQSGTTVAMATFCQDSTYIVRDPSGNLLSCLQGLTFGTPLALNFVDHNCNVQPGGVTLELQSLFDLDKSANSLDLTNFLDKTPTPPASPGGSAAAGQTKVYLEDGSCVLFNRGQDHSYICPKCDRVFLKASKIGAVNHYQANHTRLKFRCQMCSTTYANKSYLKRHLRSLHSLSNDEVDQIARNIQPEFD